MAESLKPRFGQRLLYIICMVGAMRHAVAHENLPDPTRPPPSLATAGVAAPAAATEPVLHSVLISPHRKVAVINGETVQIGDRFGDARVIRIVEGEVVLSRAGRVQTLKLFPGLEKRRTNGGASVRDTSRRQ